jgi:hypothetical protein
LYVEAKPVPTDEEFKKGGGYFAFQYRMMKRGAIFRSYVESLLGTSSDSGKKNK